MKHNTRSLAIARSFTSERITYWTACIDDYDGCYGEGWVQRWVAIYKKSQRGYLRQHVTCIDERWDSYSTDDILRLVVLRLNINVLGATGSLCDFSLGLCSG